MKLSVSRLHRLEENNLLNTTTSWSVLPITREEKKILRYLVMQNICKLQHVSENENFEYEYREAKTAVGDSCESNAVSAFD